MDSIRKHIKMPEKAPSKSERGELIDFFVREINVERQGTQYQPIDAKTVAIKTSHLSLRDLYYMKSVALDGQRRNYPISKFFFGSLKAKPENI